jgi:hypothetical protein
MQENWEGGREKDRRGRKERNHSFAPILTCLTMDLVWLELFIIGRDSKCCRFRLLLNSFAPILTCLTMDLVWLELFIIGRDSKCCRFRLLLNYVLHFLFVLC